MTKFSSLVHYAYSHPERGHTAKVSGTAISELDLAEAQVLLQWAEHRRTERTTTLPIHMGAVRQGHGELSQPAGLSLLASSVFPFRYKCTRRDSANTGERELRQYQKAGGAPRGASDLLRDLPSFLVNALQKKFCPPFKIRGFPPCLSSFKAR